MITRYLMSGAESFLRN